MKKTWLLGGFKLSENMKVSWDYYSKCMEKWNMFQTTHQFSLLLQYIIKAVPSPFPQPSQMAQLKLRLSPAPVDGNPWNTYENPENIHEHPIKTFMCNIYITCTVCINYIEKNTIAIIGKGHPYVYIYIYVYIHIDYLPLYPQMANFHRTLISECHGSPRFFFGGGCGEPNMPCSRNNQGSETMARYVGQMEGGS